ncbi:uncharacterized protein LOC117118091 [Anneissia japonica]|uniref:uncharacterized protein LOC117118091 n=1 Tax=Anneissia japonica TaxID=1529436 RepID=UPI0014258799|nr:uncharacterized protein LOC117118091 [Anneissia japonica]
MNIILAWCTVVVCISLHRPTEAVHSTEASARPESFPVFVEGKVHVSNDGPTILGSIATFYARLLDNDGNDLESGEFLFIWQDESYFEYEDLSNTTSNFTWKYSKDKAIGEHTVQLTVYYYYLLKRYADSTTFINITETINGQLEFAEGNATNLNSDIFESNKMLQIIASLYDPSAYFENADIIYEWKIWNMSESYQLVTVNKPRISFNFTVPDKYEIDVFITAFVPEDKIYLKKLGNFNSSVLIKDKVSNLQMTGSTQVTTGETRQYQITCNASLPAYLCSHLSLNSSCMNAVDGCVPVELNDTCSAMINLQFNASGTHCLSVNVSNDVSTSGIGQNIKVKKEIPHEKAVSITIGVLFGVVCCIISLYLVAQQVKKSRRTNIEVANFDFQQNESGSNFRMFTHNVKETWKLFSSKMSSKQATEYRPLMQEDRDL